MDNTKPKAPETDLRAVLIANLSATGMTPAQIAELMNMTPGEVAQYIK